MNAAGDWARKGRPRRSSHRRVIIGLVVCIFVVCLLNLIWIQLNVAPPRSWDDAEYLADSVYAYQALEHGDLIEFVRRASRPALGVHPPMMKLLAHADVPAVWSRGHSPRSTGTRP